MGIREVKMDEIPPRKGGYSSKIIQEFLESGWQRAEIDILEGKSVETMYRTIRSMLRYKKLNKEITVSRRQNKLYIHYVERDA